MGVNIGTYGYQAGAGNLLQQLNVTGPANEEEKEGETQREQEQEEEQEQEQEQEDVEKSVEQPKEE